MGTHKVLEKNTSRTLAAWTAGNEESETRKEAVRHQHFPSRQRGSGASANQTRKKRGLLGEVQLLVLARREHVQKME